MSFKSAGRPGNLTYSGFALLGLLALRGIGVLPDGFSMILNRAVPIGFGNISTPFVYYGMYLVSSPQPSSYAAIYREKSIFVQYLRVITQNEVNG